MGSLGLSTVFGFVPTPTYLTGIGRLLRLGAIRAAVSQLASMSAVSTVVASTAVLGRTTILGRRGLGIPLSFTVEVSLMLLVLKSPFNDLTNLSKRALRLRSFVVLNERNFEQFGLVQLSMEEVTNVTFVERNLNSFPNREELMPPRFGAVVTIFRIMVIG